MNRITNSRRIESMTTYTRFLTCSDGTSFAAPIVSSIAAQILEAAPELTPQQVKLALMRTAVRLPDVPVEQQGWGVVNHRTAIAEALRMRKD